MNNPTKDPNDTTKETVNESTPSQCNDIGNVSGIYKIVNKVNGKYYVGSSKNIFERKSRHLKSLRNGSHHSIHLQRAFNKYGENNFDFIIMETCEIDDTLLREQFFLDELKPFLPEIGYNMSSTAHGSDTWKSHPRRDELIRNHSVRFSGKGNPNYGKRTSEETKKLIAKNSVKIGSSNGRWRSVEPYQSERIIEEFRLNGLNSAKRIGEKMGFGWRVVHRVLNKTKTK